MAPFQFAGYVPYHTFSARGSKHRLLAGNTDLCLSVERVAIRQIQTFSRSGFHTRREILKYGLALATSGVVLSAGGCDDKQSGTPAPSAATQKMASTNTVITSGSGKGTTAATSDAAQNPATANVGPAYSFFGFSPSDSIELAGAVLAPAIKRLLISQFLPWVRDNVVPIVERFCALCENPVAFRESLHDWPGHGPCSDNLSFDNRLDVANDKPKYASLKYGFTAIGGQSGDLRVQLRPFDLNLLEYGAMKNEGQFGVPTDHRNEWEYYKDAFDRVNELYSDAGAKKSEFSKEDFEYGLPLIDLVTATKYAGICVKKNGKRHFFTTREPEARKS